MKLENFEIGKKDLQMDWTHSVYKFGHGFHHVKSQNNKLN